MLEAYRAHVEERQSENIPPKPLTPEWTSELVELIKNPPAGEEDFLLDLLANRVPPGVDEAAYVKASFLSALVKGEATSPLIDRPAAVALLGNMHGGYNVATLVDLLDDSDLAELAAQQLKSTILVFDAFYDVAQKADAGNAEAMSVMQSWADAEWFTTNDAVPQSIKAVVFKATGETNTDDLSPAQDAWSRPDIPLHARAMYKMTRDGLNPEEHGVTGPMSQIEEIKSKGLPVAFVGDVVGTGSSRKSATNSVLWFLVKICPAYPINAPVVSVLVAKLLPSSLTPWKTQAPLCLKPLWMIFNTAISLIFVPTMAKFSTKLAILSVNLSINLMLYWMKCKPMAGSILLLAAD